MPQIIGAIIGFVAVIAIIRFAIKTVNIFKMSDKEFKEWEKSPKDKFLK